MQYPKWKMIFAGIALCLITITAYIPALQSGFIWDDDVYVTNNVTLKNIEGLKKIWFDIEALPQYYPMVFTTLWVEHHIWKLKPFGYHLTNILLHIGAALLLWNVLLLLNVRSAWLISAIFALHPVHVESVAWITERKNVLSGLFYMSAMAAYLRFLNINILKPDNQSQTAAPPYKWDIYFLSIILFICALLSKTVTASLPAVILVILWWKQGRINWRDILQLFPFFIIGALMGLLTANLEKRHVNIEGVDWSLDLIDRFLVAGRALWFYIYKLFLPYQLTFIYPKWNIDSGLWWQYIYPIGFIALAAMFLFLRKKIGRGPSAAILIFAGTLFPVLGFLDIFPFRYSFVADHFQYLASISLIALFVLSLRKVFIADNNETIQLGQKGKFKLPSSSFYYCFSAGWILCLLGILTWQQGHIYKNSRTLWTDTIKKNPASPIANTHLGNYSLAQGKLDIALKHFKKVIESKPDFHEAINSMGIIMLRQGRLAEAIDYFQKALSIRPDNEVAYDNIGNTLTRQGKIKEAIAYFQKALQVNPDYAMSHFNLGVAKSSQGNLYDAIKHYKKATNMKPDFLLAHFNLGVAFSNLGKIDEAVKSYKSVLNINPGFALAHYNLGVALALQGKSDQAIEHYYETIKIKPDFSNAHSNLGVLLLKKGKTNEANTHFLKARQIKDKISKTQIGRKAYSN